jgi:endonuclease/exonuclease/phosphatase family metal-dependent hydrolase
MDWRKNETKTRGAQRVQRIQRIQRIQRVQRGEQTFVNKVLVVACIAVLLGTLVYTQVHKGVLVNDVKLFSPGIQTLPAIPVVEGAQSLRVMTFNIHYGEGKDGIQDLSRIAEVIRECDADIVGLQEVDNLNPRSRFVNQAKWLADELGMYCAYGVNLSIGPVQYGNAVLSKFPIEFYENIPLPTSGFEPRGCLWTQIDVGGCQIAFLVTHLGLSKDERARQINSIIEMLEKITVPIILVGDWNNVPDSEEVSSVASVLKDVYAGTDSNCEEEAATFAFGTRKPNVRIDYMFVSSEIVVMEVKTIETQVSDHLPVIAEVDIGF